MSQDAEGSGRLCSAKQEVATLHQRLS
jgi:hypothetical protein